MGHTGNPIVGHTLITFHKDILTDSVGTSCGSTASHLQCGWDGVTGSCSTKVSHSHNAWLAFWDIPIDRVFLRTTSGSLWPTKTLVSTWFYHLGRSPTKTKALNRCDFFSGPHPFHPFQLTLPHLAIDKLDIQSKAIHRGSTQKDCILKATRQPSDESPERPKVTDYPILSRSTLGHLK